MPTASNRGQTIHYTVEGAGPLVIFQHGLLGAAENWRVLGFPGAFTDRFQVACVDSLGHGGSDKPADPALYGQAQRAGDIVAVADALGAERFHLVGYSMGGWISVGVAKYHPKRLASLTVGGWDLVSGAATAVAASGGVLSGFPALLEGARRLAPELTAWVTPEVEPGLQACWDALSDLDGAAEAVLGGGFPVMLWNGRDDPYHPTMAPFADAHDLRYLATSGDHLGAMYLHAGEAAKGLRAFIESV
jgi:pimeloyl-ACP methyl ester carboxylesterase